MSNNLNYIKKTQTFIKAFEKDMDPEHLSEAAMELKKVNLKKETDLTAISQVRSAAVLQWLNLVQILDNHLDPAFDINKGGAMKVPPKTTPGGDSNADARKATTENNKKIQNYNLQVSFSRLNQQIPPWAKMFINKNYTGLPTDQLELKAAIEKNLKNQTRKDDFLKLLLPLPGK